MSEPPSELKVVIMTMLGSYLVAKGSAPTETDRNRTLFMIGNGLINLYIAELMKQY